MIVQNKRLLSILLVASFLLLLPLLAMQFTEEVNWSRGDFLVMGVLLFGTGFLVELIFRKAYKPKIKAGLLIALILLFLLIWAELAVGIFGTPFAGN